MDQAMSSSTTRLQGPWLVLARLTWVLVLLLAAGKLAVGIPLFYAEKARVCTSSAEVCSQGESLSLDQVQALESSGLSLATYAKAATVWALINLMIWCGIGVLIFLMRSDDWLALIASAMMILFTSGGYDNLVVQAYPGLRLLSDLVFNLQNILLFLFIALFPNGRFVPRWMRWYWLGMIAFSLPPFSIWKFSPETENTLMLIMWISFLILGPYSQIYRYRNASTPLERQQTKWVVLGFAVMAGLILLMFAFIGLSPGSIGLVFIQDFYFSAAGLLIPFSVGISVLRYRLWDIDILIRRTLVYGVLTAILALVYFGSVLLLQGLFQALVGRSQSPAVIVLSTLAIAALFTPLRRQIQNAIDRRFYRRKYDAEQALASFAELAREEVDLDEISARLLTLVDETMQPESASLWLKPKADRKRNL